MYIWSKYNTNQRDEKIILTTKNHLIIHRKHVLYNKIIIIVAALASSYIANSQDLITKTNGEDVKAKVLEISGNEVKFKKFNNLEGPIYTVLKSEILIIRYENGGKEIFDNIKTEVLSMKVTSPVPVNWKFQGQDDAMRYYRGYKGAQAGTFWTSFLLSPIVGLIPAIATSAVTPHRKRFLQYPNEEYFANSEYNTAYIAKARRMKVKKVWKSWVWGTCSFFIVGVVTTALTTAKK